MIHHSHTCSLEGVPFGFCVAFAWCGPSSGVAHHSPRFGIYASYQSRNWPIECQCSTSPWCIGINQLWILHALPVVTDPLGSLLFSCPSDFSNEYHALSILVILKYLERINKVCAGHNISA